MTSKIIIRTYLSIAAVTTLAQSLIWGVNTLFLLNAGLDIFGVMLVNAAFTFGQLVFEVPTGVIADTLGRRVSYLLSVATILVSTLLYVWIGAMHGGVIPFAFASILLGLGFTFYTGAVDAWMVDALNTLEYKGKIDVIFARAGMVFGAAMLIGTIGGGLLGQIGLWIPYVARAVLLVPAFLLGIIFMRDLGFKSRPLKLSSFGKETSKIARAGINFGLKDMVVKFLMICTFVQGTFLIYGFYSWQRYFLDLLGKELVWVTGTIAALVGLSQILGNALVAPVSKRVEKRSTILIAAIIMQTIMIIGAGLTRNFWVAVPLYLLSAISFALMSPVKQSWLNARIPSEQRATIISLDALFGDAGGTAGQVGLGYLSKIISIPFAWIIGGALQIMSLPLLLRAKSADKTEAGTTDRAQQ